MAQRESQPLPALVIDGMTEAVVMPSGPEDRAEAIAQVVSELDEAVQWRHEGDAAPSVEELSLAEVVQATNRHKKRMSEKSTTDEPPPGV